MRNSGVRGREGDKKLQDGRKKAPPRERGQRIRGCSLQVGNKKEQAKGKGGEG